MRSVLTAAVLSGLWGMAAADGAPAPRGDEVRIDLSRKVEEGKAMLVATVRRGSKPVEGAHVVFLAQRLLGWLTLGKDVTLDDGTAAVAFPADLPGGSAGALTLRAMIDDPPDLRGLAQTTVMDGGRTIAARPDPFPRSLWGPRAPVALLLTFGVLLAGVWSAYAYIVLQLIKIVRGAKR